MRLNLRALALVLGLCALGSGAKAQTYIRVTACGDPKPPAGAGNGYMDANGNICTSASSGGGGNVTVIAPLGSQLKAASVSVALPSDQTVATTPVGRTTVASTALASNLVVSATPANLYSFQVMADATLNAAQWYIMVFNSATLPGDGAVTPAKCIQMAPGSLGATFAFPSPIIFSTGIVIGVSTTGCFNKTASVHATFISGDN